MCRSPSSTPRSRRRGFGLLELLTAVAFLVILMGLMVSLARYVRASSAERITRGLLRRINEKMTDEKAPSVAAGEFGDAGGLPPPAADEGTWAAYARVSSARLSALLGGGEPVSDAWGNPIAFLPTARPDIGMAPDDRPFCVSPGPDGRYLTRADNLYSYEELPPAPAAGGHRE